MSTETLDCVCITWDARQVGGGIGFLRIFVSRHHLLFQPRRAVDGVKHISREYSSADGLIKLNIDRWFSVALLHGMQQVEEEVRDPQRAKLAKAAVWRVGSKRKRDADQVEESQKVRHQSIH